MYDVPNVQLFGVDVVSFLVGLGIFSAVYVIVTLSLNLEAGYTGIPNFGKLLFVAAGAAFATSLGGRLTAYLLNVGVGSDYLINSIRIVGQVDKILEVNVAYSIAFFMLSLLIGAGAGALFGYLSSYPAIRLREDYLGMLLLASAQFFAIFLAAYDPLIGATAGMGSPDPFRFGGTGRGVRDVTALAMMLGVAGLVYLYSERVARSPLGRALRAVRENEVASGAVGKDNVAIRKRVTVIASAIAGMAGALWAMYLGANIFSVWTRFDWTLIPWVVLILGGAGNNLGTAVGVFVFSFLIRVIGQVKIAVGDFSIPVGIISNSNGTALQFMPVDINRIEFLMVGVSLIVILMVRPEGIFPEKATFTMPRKKLERLLSGGPIDSERPAA